ncbi:uncharacterized protein si:ch211-176l24.4 [Boleophthalmus pectinirostris]|uniref:uncharacterized protein si:ch211-176l24.4 n=1 Tax=Boleophthalmus pectinirostris TaxID=150288 RepID=UPI0024307122|nr:uncharacterized protein si:ch211-176l24.4 [Boleophthalmus pectinirostris]
MHSQDLFITQKTFRLPPSELSSGETSDRAEDSTKGMEIYIRETKEQSVFFKTKKKTQLYQGNTKSSPPNPFLDEPIVVTSSLDEDEAKERVVNTKSMKSVFTQTENFFTTDLRLYFNFCKKSQHQAQSEELKPLDLCLPNRARRDSKTSNKDQHEEGSGKNVTEVSAGGCGELSMCAQRKGEQIPSPESESDNKSADTTVSSEDAEGPSLARLEVMQVRAVQMRLNESFFFKPKGEAPSPRSESPLMKLVQGRELKSHKSRKSH